MAAVAQQRREAEWGAPEEWEEEEESRMWEAMEREPVKLAFGDG